MNLRLPHMRLIGRASAILTVVVFSLATCFIPATVFGQSKFNKTYPARKNLRLHLNNWSGSITVEGWARDAIKIVAEMESPVARFTPQMDDDGMVIDVVRDNQGRGDVGNVSFKIFVPIDSTVDIETRIGNVSVNNVRGSMVRAHITSEGDIVLTNIRSSRVMAENLIGDILFDGELLSDGVYTLTSTAGNINIRIPGNSEFQLVAAAPMTRSIELGSFANTGLNSIANGRKVVGHVGDGRAALSVTNQRGSISFIRR